MSMTAASLADALGEFKRRNLIEMDDVTGEIWLADWFRFYRPATMNSRWAVEAAIQRISSSKLREKVQISYKSITHPTKEKEKEKEGASQAAGELF
jgi:hypothetical protein